MHKPTETTLSLVAGVDSSTQSCTVEIRNAQSGRLLGTGRAPHSPTFPPVSEQHPHEWWQAFALAFAAACTDAGVAATQIHAISVGAQCHGLVLLDREDNVLRAAKLWNDTTSADQAKKMVEQLGHAHWVEQIGLTPTAALTVTKLAWINENENNLLSQVGSVLLPHDWLTFKLTGRKITDRSDASGTGYYSAMQGRWLPELLESVVSPDVPWESLLPQVLGPDEIAGTVTAAIASELGLGTGVIVGVGGGDQHLGAIGLGLETGDVAFSLGTSGVVLTTSEHPVLDKSGWVDGVADATGGYLPLVCTLNSTTVTDAFARLLGVTVAELGNLALAADSSTERPTLVAYLNGERSPSRPQAQGILANLTTSVTRESLALSIFEGVIAGLVRGLDALRAAGVRVDREVIAAGGGARSLAYRQILADMLGRPVHTRDAPEATARGACVQAAAILTGKPITTVRDSWCPPNVETILPRMSSQPGVPQQYLDLAAYEGTDKPTSYTQ